MIRIMDGCENNDDLGAAFLTPDSFMVHNEEIEDVDAMMSDENTDDDDPGSGKPGVMLREQDRFLPIANIAKIMKKAVPEMGKIAKEARECLQECVSEFISFITSEASDRCSAEKRKTINGEDILFAMAQLGFDNYLPSLREYLAKYRDTNKSESTLRPT